MKDSIFEHGVLLAWKFTGGIYLLTSAFGGILSDAGFNIWFLYLGLVGQIIATLVEIQQLTSQKGYVLTFRINAFISTIVQWIIGPTLALLITSGLFVDVSQISGVVAFGIGAFWEIAWKYLKKKIRNTFNDVDNNSNGEVNKLDEDRPGGGPR